ncbi:excinuclease ABC subunit UvrA [Paludisphaera rhizosphaerae]|uniref:excinuclease ABC subunit UvrA n=1 Tax=Paludisphaera rhizosphaerae TaxID=2711216 RepID=UPI0013EC570A|nr:excinuclease ABC subunit UvrA [Paludisphaera rhizosphaerae]
MPRTDAVIRLRGARTHNLKGIDLDLPLGRLIVVTGVVGAGKSSLALDTLYAEGQRRYVETFSAYARQFLEPMEKPDVDRIEGIPPAVAPVSRTRPSARATVGTISEAHDHLALFYARRGEVYCRNCGDRVTPASPRTVSDAVDELPEGTRYEIAFPVDVLADTDLAALGRTLLEQGLTRVRHAEGIIDLTTEPLALPAPTQVDVIVDRLIRGRDALRRRLDSIETAFQRGMGRCRILADVGVRTFVRGWRCSRCGTDHIEPQPNLFRWTSSLGACPRCEGVGEEGAEEVFPPGGGRQTAQRSDEGEIGVGSKVSRGMQARRRSSPSSGPSGHLPPPGGKAVFSLPCPACHGARLRPEALAVRIGGLNIAEFSALPIAQAREVLATWAAPDEPADAVRQRARIAGRLEALDRIGLAHLTLNRPARGVSRGELRRATMVRALGTGLVGTLYVFDEPTTGLHPRDVGRMVEALQRLRDEGNTPIVVEHDADVIRAADMVVDLGPGAGEAGGRVVYAGTVAGLLDAPGSATGDFLSGRRRVERPKARRKPSRGVLTLRGASGRNLKGIDAAFPLGTLCVVTGVSGAGKSSLVEGTLYPALRNQLTGESLPTLPFEALEGVGDLAEVVLLDPSSPGRSGRSNPVTFLKAFDEIRRTFAATHEAKLRHYGPAMFSFNVDGGRCSACKGEGFRRVDMQFLPPVTVRCPDCKGTRYRPEILDITYRGKTIAEVLDLTAREAFAFFRSRPKIQARLRPLLDLGLDYLRLGQPAATLSGGEAQRLKLAAFLGGSTAALNRAGNVAHTLFILDEPTAGLHPADMVRLIDSLSNLVDRGHSVLVVEHSPEIMAAADWIVDLGPDAGEGGGRIVAQGTPEEVAKSGTATGEVLAKALAGT